MRKRLITLLVLAVIWGLNVTAQNTKPNTRIESVHAKEASLNQKSKLETPFNPQFYERMQADRKNELSLIRKNGKTVLRPGENHAAGKRGIVRIRGSKKESVKRTLTYKIGHPCVIKSTNEDAATITLKVIGDPWEDGTGFQALLDADHAIDPDAISFVDEQLFDMCEYTIPEGASADLTEPVMVLDDEISIAVPEGVYDIIFLNPDQNYGDIYICLWYDTEETAFGDDFSFEAGYEYIFIIEYEGLVEYYPPIDVALTRLTLMPVSANLTDSEEIGVVLSNVGTQSVSSVELSYRINDGETVTETYAETLTPGAEVTYTFNAKADFSEVGLYTVTAWLTYEEDMNPFNNQTTGTTEHVVPLPLPFDCGFDSRDDMTTYWTIINANGNYTWLYDNQNVDADGGVGAIQISATGDAYLISYPLIFPEAGTYHITFQTMAFGTESLRVLYGPSPNWEEMEVLKDYTFLIHEDWPTSVIDFEVPEPGTYHIAFHYYSEESEGGWALVLDNIFVGEGVFVGIPDLTFANLLVPGSSCDFSSATVLGSAVRNNGTEPVSEFTLTYRINDSEAISETFNEAIGVRESKEVYFTQPADFSTLGNYAITITASTPNEENTSDNSVSTSLTHYSPIAELPFESDFANKEDRNDWSSTLANAWGASDYSGCLYPIGKYPLLSRCIALQPGNYRFTYTYSAGWLSYGTVFPDNFYVAYGLSGSDPAGWTPVKEYFDEYTSDNTVEDKIVLNITEAGEYVIGIFPVKIGDLAIYKTSVSTLPGHDVLINRVESPASFPRKTPKYQVEGEKIFNVFVQNQGTGAETGSVELNMNNDSNPLATTDFTLSTFGEVKAVPLSVTFSALPVGPLNLQFKANIDSGDPNPDDNTIQIQKTVSDSTYVWDNIDSDFPRGLGVTGGTCKFGLVYELVKKDVLTSINIGFFDNGNSDDFGIVVYPIDDELVLGEPRFTQVQERLAGSSIVFDVPDTELEPCRYLFAVQQLTGKSIAIAYDTDPNGYFYGDFGSGLYRIDSSYGLGFIHIRPNFGKNVDALPEVKALDPSLQLYPNPVVDLLWVRLANQRIEKVSVYDASGTTVHREQGINNSEYKLNTGSLAPGLYFITVQTPAGVKTDKFVVKK
ncbi:MAG: DUF2436 domain-containing protein [Dysgonamonadaceae bacterium]|jgi:hypothetical protein|nr:DUF2436 domain-containing protein [Dysgonamonadaceae bacterium]